MSDATISIKPYLLKEKQRWTGTLLLYYLILALTWATPELKLGSMVLHVKPHLPNTLLSFNIIYIKYIP